MNLLNDTNTFSLRPFSGPDGRMFSLLQRNGTDDFYMRQDQIVQEAALKIQQPPEKVWDAYLEHGGEVMRDGLFAAHGCERVTFTDISGYMWIKMELAMDFCALYNPTLREAVHTYYRRYKMGLRGPEVLKESAVPAASDSRERLAAHVAVGFALVEECFTKHDARITKVDTRITGVEKAQQKDREENNLWQTTAVTHIAAYDRKVDSLANDIKHWERKFTLYERTVRGFCENVCGYQPSVEEAKQWGSDLTKRYGSQMPRGKFPKTELIYGGKPVNYYEPHMLIEYFTERGLYKSQAQLRVNDGKLTA